MQITRHIGNSTRASLPYQVAQHIQEHDEFLLVITPDSAMAEQLHQETPSFLDQPCFNQHFPSWETLPYDHFSPHQDITSQRLTCLNKLPKQRSGVLFVSIKTLMHPLPPAAYLQQHALLIKTGDLLDIPAYRQQLEQAGYQCVSQVLTHGEFCVRGSIIDLFPMGSGTPYRIDLFDNQIDSIRTFDPESQRSLETIDSIELLPAHEFPLTSDSSTIFAGNWQELFQHCHESDILDAVAAQRPYPGLEYYLPLFFGQTTWLFDYLPNQTQCFVVHDALEQAQQFSQEIAERYALYRHDRLRPCLPPETLFLLPKPLEQRLAQHIQHHLIAKPRKAGKENMLQQALPDLTATRSNTSPLAKLSEFVQASVEPVLFQVTSKGRQEVLNTQLKKAGIDAPYFDTLHAFERSKAHTGITRSPLQNSLWIPKKWVLLCEPSLYAHAIPQQTQSKKTANSDHHLPVYDLSELTIGTPVVHIEHGVGRYLGLSTLTVQEQPQEFLTLEYADQHKLYVPIQNLHLISRYSSTDIEHAPLNKLGSDQWEKAKKKAAKKLEDTAAELLDIYARRAAKKGFSCCAPDETYDNFAASFPFEPTMDQQNAIEAVLKDMQKNQPMDRLLCGDVGFGKTEVAMRAAFLAAANHKQVAILVPTTLLAQQHYDNFCDRFADYPIEIALLSRFRTAKEQQNIMNALTLGTVDIVIGTHKLLSPNIQFKDLGLVIIDEEHRFGVKHKDKLKSLRAEVDILTMTATPIPRTLNMSLSAIRDLSIISTPPAKRLSVKTFVKGKERLVIQEAISREINRGGQVFYLHNDVQTIDNTVQQLQEWFPTLKIAIGHGQMREKTLEGVMADFYHNRYHILVCSTIIETGIDIPNANTIIIERADKLGLAQLHQLRGRVGRSHHQAYAYLLTPPLDTLKADAKKRLLALENTESIGGGFMLASHDLEIRGAGELLGKEQSGNMQAIGFNLYMDLLDRTVQAMKAGKTLDLTASNLTASGCEVELGVSALIPEHYLPDVQLRLECYKRIANANTTEQLEAVQVEMIDRFGLLPEPTQTLMSAAALKQQAAALGISKIQLHPKQGGNVQFTEQPKINASAMIRCIQNAPHQFKLQGEKRLILQHEWTTFPDKLNTIQQLLEQLTPKT